VTPQVNPQVARLLEAAHSQPLSRREMQEILGLGDREHFRKAHLDPLIAAGWLRRTIPDKPNSRLQRYQTTPAGEAVLAGRQMT
jgi:ATP-dependent DNA helicase RecG